MSRHSTSTPPGIVATIVGLAGLVTSTIPFPHDSPISAYSRPDGEVYPQQSAPLAPAVNPAKLFSGIQVSSVTLRAGNVASPVFVTAGSRDSSFHGSGFRHT